MPLTEGFVIKFWERIIQWPNTPNVLIYIRHDLGGSNNLRLDTFGNSQNEFNIVLQDLQFGPCNVGAIPDLFRWYHVSLAHNPST